MIQIVAGYPDVINEDGILTDGTRVFQTDSIDEFEKIIKQIYHEGIVNHVHIYFGYVDDNNNFHITGEIIIPFKNDVNIYVRL